MRSFSGVFIIIGFALILALPVTGTAGVSESDVDAQTPVSQSDEAGSPKTIDELAREMSIPLAAFTGFAYNVQHRTYQGSIPGAGDQSNWSYVLQPVLPFRQKNGKGWVFRFALPYIVDQPIYWADRGYPEWLIRQVDPTVDQDGDWGATHSHTDAVSTDLVYGGISDSGLILMYGLSGMLPTSSDTSNARQQLLLGPALNIGKMTDWGTYGALVSHIIDVAEKRDKGTPDTTQTTIQAYFSYGLGNGWQLISNPTITYDWEGDSSNKLNLPLGGGFAKTFKIRKIPIRITAELQKYVASTDRFGPDWSFKLSIIPILPNKYTRN